MVLRLPPAHLLCVFCTTLHETFESQSFGRVCQLLDIDPSNLERPFFHEQCFHLHQPDDRHIDLCTHVKTKHKTNAAVTARC
jgi:hypothetical protein